MTNFMKKLKNLFTKNLRPKQKQYEALRSIAMDGLSYAEAAEKFNYSPQTIRNLKQLFVAGKLDFFPVLASGPKGSRSDENTVARILELRKDGKSIYEIFDNLKSEDMEYPLSSIAKIISDSGIAKLSRRTNQERNIGTKKQLLSARSGLLDFKTLQPFKIDCPVAGLFLFLPYIIESGIVDVIKKCALPGSSDIECAQAALSFLALKLIGTERLSHIRSYDAEPSLGIFAGLNTLPKPSFIGSYSCRTSEEALNQLQKEFLLQFKKKYPDFYSSDYINLDFHSIPHFGEESKMEKVWSGMRGKALKGANTIFAQDAKSDLVIYTKANILRKNEAHEIKSFVQYWKEVKGNINETLVFDCRLTSYEVLGELDAAQSPVKFITLRKRNEKVLRETEEISEDKWEKIKLPIPKRKHQKFLVHECKTLLTGCKKEFRQIIIKNHGRSKPTFVITNNWDLGIMEILTVYAKRWHIENKLNELISFFSLNALSSPIMTRIHFDIFWTMVADTIYHLMAADLPRYEQARAGTIFRNFINFPGRVDYDGKSFVVKIRKRAHTPIILGVKKLNQPVKVPWLNNASVKVVWTA